MSGTKLDMDSVRDANNFGPAKFVVDDVDIDSLLNGTSDPSDVPKTDNESAQTGDKENVTETDLNTVADAIKSAIKSAKASDKPMKSSIKSALKSSTQQTMVSLVDTNIGVAEPMSSIKERYSQSHQETEPSAPPLSEHHVATPPLSSKGRKDLETPDNVLPEEEEFDMMPQTPAEKHMFWKTKLQTLKMRFPDTTIPRQVADLSWEEIRKIYYIQLDRVSIDKNVNSYKMIMIVMFFITELVVAKLLKVDITGFTVHSIRSMHRYERLLIELGEKNYSSFGENWPVELRLFAMVIVNAIIFVIAKSVFKLTNSDMSEEFYRLFENLGNETVQVDVNTAVGMDAPPPDGNEGGLMGMLGGILGGLGGGGNGGNGGLGDILGSVLEGLGGSQSAPASMQKPKEGKDGDERIKRPKYRRKKKRKKKPESE